MVMDVFICFSFGLCLFVFFNFSPVKSRAAEEKGWRPRKERDAPQGKLKAEIGTAGLRAMSYLRISVFAFQCFQQPAWFTIKLITTSMNRNCLRAL
jgi:hypothetical protein